MEELGNDFDFEIKNNRTKTESDQVQSDFLGSVIIQKHLFSPRAILVKYETKIDLLNIEVNLG